QSEKIALAGKSWEPKIARRRRARGLRGACWRHPGGTLRGTFATRRTGAAAVAVGLEQPRRAAQIWHEKRGLILIRAGLRCFGGRACAARLRARAGSKRRTRRR